MFVRVKLLRVDAVVSDDVAVGFGDVAPPTAHVSVRGAAVHQVLWTQWNQDSRFFPQLALQSPQRAEGPAGAAQTLSHKNI